jgi:hypothetical protein
MARAFSKKNRWLIIGSIVVAIAAFSLVRTLGTKREPSYKNKPISYWADQACRGYDSSAAYNARFDITNIGPAAVPYLLKRLRTSDRWRGIWFSIQAHLPSQLQIGGTNSLLPGEIRYGAARTLSLLGSDAKPAVPDLIRLLPRTEVPAVETLMTIGPEAKEALPALRSLLLNTTNVSRRVQIAGALWEIGHETNLVLQVCTNALASNSGDDGINAAAYLTQLGRAAAPAVPFALALLQDTNRNEGARGNAANLLGAAQVCSPEVQAALSNGTNAENPRIVRGNCATALWLLTSPTD